jgi:hypothetical protein
MTTSRYFAFTTGALALLALAGCGGKEQPKQDAPQQPAQQSPAQQRPAPPLDPSTAQSGQLPPGHTQIPPGGPNPMGGAPQLAPPQPGTGVGSTGLSWTAPPGWTSETPSSAMRRAQYKVDGAGGAGECAVFYFGPGEGGDPKANLDRWISQFQGPNGPAKSTSNEFKVGDIPVHVVEVTGTFFAGSMMGGQPQEKPNYMLLGAVVQGPDANWFFKFTGPEQTVKAQKSAFEAMLKSVKKGA